MNNGRTGSIPVSGTIGQFQAFAPPAQSSFSNRFGLGYSGFLFSHDLWEKFVTEIALSLFNLSRVESKALAIDLTVSVRPSPS